MRAIRRPLLVASLVGAALVGGAVSLFAEDLDVPKLFDSAKAAYGEKHYGKCWADLQMVVAEVARMRMEALKQVLPGAPKDWKAEEAEGDASSGLAWFTGGTHVRRRFTKGDETSAELSLWADAPAALMMGVTMFAQNPAFLPAGSKLVTIKGRKAVLEFRKDDKAGKLTIVLNVPNSILEVEARGVTSADLSDGIPAAFDLDAIEKAITN